jgi:uncharacterized protein
VFDPLLGAMLLVGAAVIMIRREPVPQAMPGRKHATLVESDGTVHHYQRRLAAGAALSVLVGFASSLLGIGGGILHVPLMVFALGFPIHVATATSHFVLALLGLAGLLVHVADGSLVAGLDRVLPLAVGVLLGAPFGAAASSRVRPVLILRGLAVALALVGLRLLFAH